MKTRAAVAFEAVAIGTTKITVYNYFENFFTVVFFTEMGAIIVVPFFVGFCFCLHHAKVFTIV